MTMEWLQNQSLNVVVVVSAGAGAILTGLGFLLIKQFSSRRQGKGAFKLYHQHCFRSSRCLWLIEGKMWKDHAIKQRIVNRY